MGTLLSGRVAPIVPPARRPLASPPGCGPRRRRRRRRASSGRSSARSASHSSSSGRPASAASAARSRSMPSSTASVAALDEPVGVEQQRPAGGQDRLAVRALGAGVEAEQEVARLGQDLDLAVGPQEHRRRVAGAGPAQRAGRPARAPAGGSMRATTAVASVSSRRPLMATSTPVQDLRRAVRRRRRPMPRSRLRSWPIAAAAADVVADDVADDDDRGAVGLQEGVVPVAADLRLVRGRAVARRRSRGGRCPGRA